MPRVVRLLPLPGRTDLLSHQRVVVEALPFTATTPQSALRVWVGRVCVTLVPVVVVVASITITSFV